MYKSKNHTKYSLIIHLVFVVKYRHPLLCNRNVSTEEDLSDFIKKWADKNNFIYNVQSAERMLA